MSMQAHPMRIIGRSVTYFSSLLLLALGGLTYVFFRPRTILMFQVIDKMGLGEWVDNLRDGAAYHTLPGWMVYCLPNGLWSASYILLMGTLMNGRNLYELMAWTCIIPALGILSELMQGMGILNGTYDPVDLACYALPYLIYLSTLFFPDLKPKYPPI